MSLFLFSALPSFASAQEPLTNRRIVELLHAGVRPDELVSIIATAPKINFDLTPAGSDALRKAGVSEAVSKAMIAKERESSLPMPLPPPVDLAPPTDPLSSVDEQLRSATPAKEVIHTLWEYKTVYSDRELNELTANGWEFVTMTTNAQGNSSYLMRMSKSPPRAEIETKPVLIYKVEPHYTREAFKRHIEGDVLLSLTVTDAGQSAYISVIRSLDPGLDESAIAAVKEWQFRPGTRDGQKIATKAQIAVHFAIIHGEVPRFWFFYVYR